MKTTACVGIGIVILCYNSALGVDGGKASMRVRPIQVISCDEVPAGIPFDMLPVGFQQIGNMRPIGLQPTGQQSNSGQPGFQIFYLVEGQDILRFDSLVVDEIKTPEGVDISKYPTGEHAYEAGPFPQTSADGKYCIFSLAVPRNQFGKVERLSIKGSATILRATKREQEMIDLKPTDKDEIKVGPFSVQLKPGGRSPMSVLAIPLTIAPTADNKPEGVGSATPAEPRTSDSIDVEITGPLKKFITATFTDGGSKLQPLCVWDVTRRTYTLLKPKTGKIALTISYCIEMAEVKLPFGQ